MWSWLFTGTVNQWTQECHVHGSSFIIRVSWESWDSIPSVIPTVSRHTQLWCFKCLLNDCRCFYTTLGGILCESVNHWFFVWRSRSVKSTLTRDSPDKGRKKTRTARRVVSEQHTEKLRWPHLSWTVNAASNQRRIRLWTCDVTDGLGLLIVTEIFIRGVWRNKHRRRLSHRQVRH